MYKQLIEDFEQEDEYDDDIFEEKKDLLTSNKDILNAIRGHLHEMRSNFEVPAEVGVLTKGQINEQSGELDEDDTYGFVTNWDEEKNTFTISYLVTILLELTRMMFQKNLVCHDQIGEHHEVAWRHKSKIETIQ